MSQALQKPGCESAPAKKTLLLIDDLAHPD
jgi:hypothetical protein